MIYDGKNFKSPMRSRYIKKFKKYNIPFWDRFLGKAGYIGEFEMVGFEPSDLDDIQDWAKDSCMGCWEANLKDNFQEQRRFVIKFELEEDASLFKLVWQSDD